MEFVAEEESTARATIEDTITKAVATRCPSCTGVLCKRAREDRDGITKGGSARTPRPQYRTAARST